MIYMYIKININNIRRLMASQSYAQLQWWQQEEPTHTQRETETETERLGHRVKLIISHMSRDQQLMFFSQSGFSLTGNFLNYIAWHDKERVTQEESTLAFCLFFDAAVVPNEHIIMSTAIGTTTHVWPSENRFLFKQRAGCAPGRSAPGGCLHCAAWR